MPSNLEMNLKTVIDQFTPDILGVFWITNEELSRDLLGFDQFNYLFDGLISQYLYGQEQSTTDKHLERSNVFITKNFNQNLFLAHLKMHREMASVLDDQMTLVQKEKTVDRKKILLFNQTEKDWSSVLAEHYPQFQFIELELSKD